jgi:cytochrome c
MNFTLKGTQMKSIAIAAFVTIGMFSATAANASESLAKSSGCLGCHAIDAKKVGPGFKDVAGKYKGKGDAEAALSAKLNTAKGHPKVKASEDDVKTLTKWILAM